MENENKHHKLSSTKQILKLTRNQISWHKSTESQRILSTHLLEVIRILWVPLIHQRNFSFVLYNSKYRASKTRQSQITTCQICFLCASIWLDKSFYTALKSAIQVTWVSDLRQKGIACCHRNSSQVTFSKSPGSDDFCSKSTSGFRSQVSIFPRLNSPNILGQT